MTHRTRRALQQALFGVVVLVLALSATAVAATTPPAPAEPALGQAPAAGPDQGAAQDQGAPQEPAAGEAPAASQTQAPAPTVQRGDTLTAPPVESQGDTESETGKGQAEKPAAKPKKPKPGSSQDQQSGGGVTATPPTALAAPVLPSSTCAPAGVPAILIPIYQRASATYGLGPQGPNVLAAINGIETAFGTNLNVSSAGAVGWMQFMPATWETYGVDANGDGVRDPYNPEDAIFAAANYLSASGMPADTSGAVFAYNHADWYVADVLANAECYERLGGAIAAAFDLAPKLQVLSCEAARPWRKRIPAQYLSAFEAASARYGLGRRGVWVLAAVARLESNFGRGMDKRTLHKHGPLGLDGREWRRFAVDGDGDGHIRREDPDDSAATLARLIWSRGGPQAGLFSHNQAQWYVEAVRTEADRMEGRCRTTTVDWALALPNVVIAPIDWQNLTLSNDLEKRDLDSGAIDPRIVGLIGAITQGHEITLSALRSDHSMYTVEGNVSNHYFGRAMDIAAVDGVPCTDTAPTAPCATLGRTLAYLPAPARPTELIYCFDLDGPGPAFARSDHCDHVHVGYDG